MSILSSAFGALFGIKSRPVTLYRLGTALSVSVRVSSVNYSRNVEALGNTVTPGRQYLMLKSELDAADYGVPKRGDKINHPDLGVLTISEVEEITELGEKIMGYRVKTS